MYRKHIAYHQQKLVEYQALQAEYETAEAEKTAAAENYSKVLASSSWDFPIPYTVGDYVEAGYCYACQNVKFRALKSGVPYGLTDAEYFAYTPEGTGTGTSAGTT